MREWRRETPLPALFPSDNYLEKYILPMIPSSIINLS